MNNEQRFQDKRQTLYTFTGEILVKCPKCQSSLWLSAPCEGKILWAYNLQHLELIEKYVSAALREHQRDPQYGWSNRSFVNRLPKWIKIAKNRENVLKVIGRLKQTVPI